MKKEKTGGATHLKRKKMDKGNKLKPINHTRQMLPK